MNGILHNCSHPSDGVTKRLSEKDLVQAVYTYIDKVISVVRPKKLVYLAIDGCAPRAKLNQQRARRFRAAKDLAEARRKEAESQGEQKIADDEVFDSNCITPGTVFMTDMSRHLHYFVPRLNLAVQCLLPCDSSLRGW